MSGDGGDRGTGRGPLEPAAGRMALDGLAGAPAGSRQPLGAAGGPDAAGAIALAELQGVSLRRPASSVLRTASEPDLVSRLDWRIAAGERWAVIGRNAAGKSTLLRALAGLQPPASGHVLWVGQPPGQWAPQAAAAHRAWMPQHSQDRFRLSVARLLALSRCGPGGLGTEQALALLGAGALLRRDVRELSGGERQRVALAQVLVQGARLWLLDEPVAFQDPAHQAQVAQVLRQQVGEGAPCAAVFSAHDINWVAAVATHVLALLGDGRWRAGLAAELLGAALLEEVYGCGWRQAGGLWIPLI